MLCRDDSGMDEIRNLRHRSRLAGGEKTGRPGVGAEAGWTSGGSMVDLLTPNPLDRNSPSSPNTPTRNTTATAAAAIESSAQEESGDGDGQRLVAPSPRVAEPGSPSDRRKGGDGRQLLTHAKLGPTGSSGSSGATSVPKGRGRKGGGDPSVASSIVYSSATYDNRDWDGRYVLPAQAAGMEGVMEMTAPRVVTVKEIRRVHRTNLHSFIEHVRRELDITSFLTTAIIQHSSNSTGSGAAGTLMATANSGGQNKIAQSIMPYIQLMHGAWPVLPVPTITLERFEGGSIRSLLVGWAKAPQSTAGGALPPLPNRPASPNPIASESADLNLNLGAGGGGGDAKKSATASSAGGAGGGGGRGGSHVPNAPLLLRLRWLFQLAQAIDFIHSHGIVHRAITPDNVLVSSDLQSIKLTNFGMAKRLYSDTQSTTPQTTADPFFYEKRGVGSTGTHYDAPETTVQLPAAGAGAAASAGGDGLSVAGKSSAQSASNSNNLHGIIVATAAVDIYSFGVLAKELNTAVRIPVLHQYTSTLAESCMHLTPSKRPAAAQIVERLSLLLGLAPTFRAVDLMKANRSESSVVVDSTKNSSSNRQFDGSTITRPVDIKYELQQHAGGLGFRYQTRVLWISEKEKSIRFIEPRSGTTIEFPFNAFTSVSRQPMEYL